MALLQELRGLPVRAGALASASVVSGVLVFRFLGNSAEQARILFEQAWRVLRPVIAGRPACSSSHLVDLTIGGPWIYFLVKRTNFCCSLPDSWRNKEGPRP